MSEELKEWQRHFPEYKVVDGKLCHSGMDVPLSLTAEIAQLREWQAEARMLLMETANYLAFSGMNSQAHRLDEFINRTAGESAT